jgi:hypothetical protein
MLKKLQRRLAIGSSTPEKTSEVKSMAKTIKFNLLIDDEPVRNLDDLQANFNIEDILTAYKSGLLKRWLETRELKDKISELDKISSDKDDIEVAKELCCIFDPAYSPSKAEEVAYSFKFRQQEDESNKQFENIREQKTAVIRAYHEGYNRLLQKLQDNSTNYSFVKAGIESLFQGYVDLYILDANAFYSRFKGEHHLVLLAMLANPNMRELISQPLQEVYNDFSYSQLIESVVATFDKTMANGKKQPGIKEITNEDDCKKLKNRNITIWLPHNSIYTLENKIIDSSKIFWRDSSFYYVPLNDICPVKTFSGATNSYWKDLVPKGRSCLIITLGDGDMIRNQGKDGEELNPADVNGLFPTLDGIDYKSNNTSNKLFYMEV